jgi:uncharacterized membrane protein YqjE
MTGGYLLPTSFSVTQFPRRMVTDDDTSKTPRNDSLISNLTGYLDTRIDLVRLELQQKVKDILVGTVHGMMLAILGLLFLVFLSIFAGLALNAALNSSYWGFGIVAGFYLLLLILVLVGVDKAAFSGTADKLLKDTIYKSDKRQA